MSRSGFFTHTNRHIQNTKQNLLQKKSQSLYTNAQNRCFKRLSHSKTYKPTNKHTKAAQNKKNALGKTKTKTFSKKMGLLT